MTCSMPATTAPLSLQLPLHQRELSRAQPVPNQIHCRGMVLDVKDQDQHRGRKGGRTESFEDRRRERAYKSNSIIEVLISKSQKPLLQNVA